MLRLNSSSEDLYISNFPGSPTSPNEIDYCSGQWTIGGVPAAYRSFFKFDLSSIPAGSIINSASLNLFYQDTNAWKNCFEITYSLFLFSRNSVVLIIRTA